ncbi:unnamed protein product [Scytosiphon promiscuus]
MRYSSPSMTRAAALMLLAGWQLGAAQVVDVCGPASDLDYQYEVSPTDGFTIRWSIDVGDETISFQVVSAAAAWTGIGFSSDGMMVGSDAVVGLPDDVSVLEYEMTGKSVEDVVPFDVQDITDGSVSQDASGETTLTFTRPLSPGGDKQAISTTPGDTAIFIYSYGTDNTLAYHDSSGTVVVDPFCGDASASDGDAATPAGTPAPAAVEPPPVEEGQGDETPAPAFPSGGGDGGRDGVTPSPSVLDEGGDQRGGAGTPSPSISGGGGGGRGDGSVAPTLSGGGGGRGSGSAAPTLSGGGGGRGAGSAAPTLSGGGGGGGRGDGSVAPTLGGGGGGRGSGSAAPTLSGGGGGRGAGSAAPTLSGGGGGRGAGSAAPSLGGGGGGRGAGSAAPTLGGGGGGRGSGSAAPTLSGGGGGEEGTDTTTPAPAAEDGDRGVVTTASPTGDPGSIVTTAGPSTAEDADGQGDSDGAFRGGERGWVAMAATGIMTVLAMLSL